MPQHIFHPSIEGAQHGGKSLDEFLRFAKDSGAKGAQPSNYLLDDDSGGFLGAAEIKDTFAKHGLKLDGVSAHCPFWVHTSAWTGTKTGRPFLPADLHSADPATVESKMEEYLLRLLDLLAELDVRICPMFWGVAYGWEIATGYPWGFWKGPGYDLIQEGHDRFRDKTAAIRKAANERDIRLAHEIHPNSAAVTADDFLALRAACDGDACLKIIADPSHCWEGESLETRFRKVGEHVVAAHVKNHVVRDGFPLRGMKNDWPNRAMQFCDLSTGDLNLTRYVEVLIDVGYPQRFREITGADTAPLIVEAESAFRELDATSADGIRHCADDLCFPLAAGSFEEGMGS